MTVTTTRIFLHVVSNRIICKEFHVFRRFVKIYHLVAFGASFSFGLVKQKGGKNFEKNGCQEVGPSSSLLSLSSEARNGHLSLSSLFERLEDREIRKIMADSKTCLFEKDIKEGMSQKRDDDLKEFDHINRVDEVKENEDTDIQEEKAVVVEITEFEKISKSRESKEIVMKKEEINDVTAMGGLRKKEKLKDLIDNKKEKLDDDDNFCLGTLFDSESYGYQEVEKRLQADKKLGSAKRSWRKRKGKFNKGIDEGQANEVDMGRREGGVKRRNKGAKGRGSKSGELGKSEGNEEEKEKRLLPNYFLAIRIDDPSIYEEVKKCQDSIVEEEKLFKHVLIAVPTLHITLLVMRINDDDDMTNAKDALQECKCALQKLYRDCSQELVFTGLGHFRNKVVFLDMEKKSQEPLLVCLENMVKLLKESYNAKGFTLSNDSNDDFKPHATIMKMSKNMWKMKKKGIRKIDNKYFKDFAEYDFGTQRFCEILLCSMLDKKDENGFYNIVDRLDLKVLPDEDEDA